MKSLLVASLLLLPTFAMASKARVSALQGAADLVDTQTIFANPAHIHLLKPLVTFELGQATTTANPKAEGGFLMEKDGTRWGAYFGHMSATQNLLRGATATAYPKMDNPVDFFYGRDGWAVNVALSSSEDETTTQKQSTAIVRYGLIAETWRLGLTAEVLASAENNAGTDNKYNGAPVLGVAYEQSFGQWVFDANLTVADTKQQASTVDNKVKLTSIELSLLHRPVEGLYYGFALNSSEFQVEDKKRKSSGLPLVVGLEKDVMSWLVFRGSVRQNFLIGSSEDEIAGTKAKKNSNDTSVAVGLGVKYGEFLLDGTLAGSTSGKVDGNNVLTNAAVTYNF